MPRQGKFHCIGVLLPKLGAAFDVGEEKGDGSAGECNGHFWDYRSYRLKVCWYFTQYRGISQMRQQPISITARNPIVSATTMSMQKSSSLRDGEQKGAATSFDALRPNFSPVRLDQMARNGKAQTGAAARAGAVNFVEAFKDARQVIGWDADSRIMHQKTDKTARLWRSR